MSFLFDGVDAQLRGTLTTSITYPVTIAAWRKYATVPTAPGEGVQLGTTQGSNDSSVALGFSSSYSTRLRTYNATGGTSGTVFSGNPTTADNEWEPALMICTSTTSRQVWVENEATDATNTTSNNAVGGWTIVDIGERFNNSEPFNGWIAEEAIWNIALNSTARGLFFSGTLPSAIEAANLRFYHSGLTNNLTNTGLDATGDLTANGGAVWDADHPPVGITSSIARLSRFYLMLRAN